MVKSIIKWSYPLKRSGQCLSSRDLVPESVSLLKGEPPAAWVRWLLPSIADVFFLVLVGILFYSPMSVRPAC